MNEILKNWLKQCEYDYSTLLSFMTEDIYSEFWEVWIGSNEITPCLFDSIRLDIQTVLSTNSQYINSSVNNMGNSVTINYWLKNKESFYEIRRIVDKEKYR